MKTVFSFLFKLSNKWPLKVLAVTLLVLVLMIVGATQIQMATGNETLVQADADAYISNLDLEDTFGGEAIIALFSAEDPDTLLDLENIRSIWAVHQAMEYQKNIFSLMSPAGIVNQVAEMQVEEIQGRVEELSSGLEEISQRMTDLSAHLSSQEVPDMGEIEAKLAELSQVTDVFANLVEVQNNLGDGTLQMQLGMGEMAAGLEQAATQLQTMAENAPPQLGQQLGMMAGNIQTSSQGLGQMAENAGQLQMGNEETAKALEQMEDKISSELQDMQSNFSGGVDPDQLMEMASGLATVGENLDTIASALDMFYAKSGMVVADIPEEQEELDEIFIDDDSLRDVFANVYPDENHALMLVKLDGNLEDAEKDAVQTELTRLLDEQDFAELDYVVTGKPVLDTSLRAEMKDNMQSMVALAVAIMIVILLLIFKVRWRILPLVTVFIAVLATLGLMAHLSIPMTMVSMAVFPILIGLGIDYSIQFQNRYEEEHSLKATLPQMGPAIGTAVFATVLGFIALFISPVPMIQDFGKMLTIGVIISYLAGIFFLLPMVYIRDRFFSADRTPKVIKLNRLGGMLQKLTGKLLRYSVVILVVAVALAAWGIYADGKVGVETDIETFMPQDTEALEDIHELRDVMGSTDQVVLYLEAEDVLERENWDWIADKSQALAQQFPDIIVETQSIASLVDTMAQGASYDEVLDIIEDIPASQRKMFLSADHDRAAINLNIEHLAVEEVQIFVQELERAIQDTPMDVSITGKSTLDVEMVEGLTSGRTQMTFLGLGLVFLGLLLVYRNFFKAFIPVFPISLIVGLSGGIMSLLGLKYTPLTATLGALILGIGTEMTILLLERYIEERKDGLDKVEAMKTAVGKIGVAILASGITTIGGFSVLMISRFEILKDFGLMTVINMSLALFSTLVVLPSLIYLLDRWIVGAKLKKKEQLAQ